jgi:quercetin dioxygenase-like cupin family protein
MSEWVIVSEGVRRRILQDGEQLMLVQFEFEPGKSVPLHSHHHEQISYVVSGKMDFNRDGEVVEVGPGQSIRLPSNVKHGATARETSVLLETFSPPREDFRPKQA